jgi:tyrosine-protein phosphatase SIW14
MKTFLSICAGILIAAAMIAAPFYYHRLREREDRNFHVVHDGVLYRSGQLPLYRLKQICAQYGIRTVVSLRDGTKTNDEEEEKWVKAKALNFVRIQYREWWPDKNGKVPAEKSVQEFRDVMDDPKNYPVLVHCFAGIHRTGMMCAVYRMDYQGWTNDEAMNEMRAMGYTILDEHEDVLGYLIRYRSPQNAKTIPAIPVNRKGAHP